MHDKNNISSSQAFSDPVARLTSKVLGIQTSLSEITSRGEVRVGESVLSQFGRITRNGVDGGSGRIVGLEVGGGCLGVWNEQFF